jgi:putative restriction endonuclease
MPSLANHVLRAKLAGALPEARFETGAEVVHPALAVVPGFGPARIYVWTVTPDRSAPGARPIGEFKIQLILPGQPRNARRNLEFDGPYTVLLGYSPDFGVFVGWQPRLYVNFSHSRNVQTREELLQEARNTGWAIAAPRRMQAGIEEVRVAFTAGNMLHFFRTSRAADQQRYAGKWREAFFLANTPNAQGPMAAGLGDLDENVVRQRERVAATRLLRDATFSPKVKKQYGYACAVCAVQLEIVEGAHIVPVSEPGSSDAVWNGVCLCPSHHELFDGSAFVVDAGLRVLVDGERAEYLRANGLDQGINILTDFGGSIIRPPAFWDSDADFRGRMSRALTRRVASAGLA